MVGVRAGCVPGPRATASLAAYTGGGGTARGSSMCFWNDLLICRFHPFDKLASELKSHCDNNSKSISHASGQVSL